jgi:hypothetical protein
MHALLGDRGNHGDGTLRRALGVPGEVAGQHVLEIEDDLLLLRPAVSGDQGKSHGGKQRNGDGAAVGRHDGHSGF